MGNKKLHVELIEFTPNPDKVVALAAKMCYSGSDLSGLKGKVDRTEQASFINTIINMNHLSTIEHVVFTFGIEGVSRSLLAQITRHRIASFSVKSQRYVGEVSSKQGDGVFGYIIPPKIEELGEEYIKIFEAQMQQMQQWYDFWLEKLGNQGEKSNEDARFVLPNAAETKMLVTMNERELIHFFSLRCCNRAQWEIRALADEMLKLVKEVSPALFENAGPNCVSGACQEGKSTCGKAKEVREKYRGNGSHLSVQEVKL